MLVLLLCWWKRVRLWYRYVILPIKKLSFITLPTVGLELSIANAKTTRVNQTSARYIMIGYYAVEFCFLGCTITTEGEKDVSGRLCKARTVLGRHYLLTYFSTLALCRHCYTEVKQR